MLDKLLRSACVIGLLGFLAYFVLFVLAVLRNPTYVHFVQLLYGWQTQVSAAFALVAAFIGAVLIRYQITENDRIESERRRRRVRALRATLPLALSELSDYAIRIGEQFVESYTVSIQNPTAKRVSAYGFELPIIPSGLVTQLTDLIESSDELESRPLELLVSQLQIQHARAQDHVKRGMSRDTGKLLLHANIVCSIVDAAEIQSRCALLIQSIRQKTNVETLTSDFVKASLLLFSSATINLIDETNVIEEIECRSWL